MTLRWIPVFLPSRCHWKHVAAPLGLTERFRIHFRDGARTRMRRGRWFRETGQSDCQMCGLTVIGEGRGDVEGEAIRAEIGQVGN